MAEVLTHAEWKAGKKKYKVMPPPNKQDIGPTLDKYHRAKTLKDTIALLTKVIAGIKVIRDANKDFKEAAAYLDKTVKELKAALFDVKKNGLKSPEMEGEKKKVDAKIKALTMDEVWKDKKLKGLFRKFLAANLNTETYDFLDAVDHGNTPDIYEEFVPLGSSQQINIKDATRKDLEKQYQLKPMGPLNYKNAYSEVFTMIGRDNLPRFKAAQYNKEIDDLETVIADRMGIL